MFVLLHAKEGNFTVGNDLVSNGDTKYEVLKKCGQPVHKEFLGVAEAKKYTRKVKTDGDVKVEVWI